ncbi:hypothetical protein BLA24_27940 [Streptomyces cinnamoneus]|uniref:HNH endonuclease n=1 Tax=Streptomyces cinnamoneus TaxID=53446 RepID=A0A2G1XCE1_STRCJ|nr:hypothetical protein [Streptomyces cinnamoneus]PHQ48892.1 hypothetical protein BLA24_27940 [Streptomyces cinnamoneus]PPT14460.1 hypothetical protein CYQ11_17700 [Streptomyces cinnamoneus]
MPIAPRWAVLTAATTVIVLTAAGCSSDSGGDDKTDAKGTKAGQSAAPPPTGPAPGTPSGTASPGGPSGGTADGTIPAGPGPQPAYTVQQQPAPGTCAYRYTADKQPLPDPKCTPGATNPKVTQATLKTTICRGGYTAGIRPPTNITGREKTANAASYGYKGSLKDAEYDHLISLQLGGDPNDPRNLWVQPPSPGHKAGAGPNNPKDVVESKVKAAICAGKTDLVTAQRAIAKDWTTALSVLGVSTDKKAPKEEQKDEDDG